jgi:hypothetical protein
MKRFSLGAALVMFLISPTLSQTYKDSLGTVVQGVAPLVGCASFGSCVGPVSTSNPLPVTGTFSASLGGFTPGSVGTPITATTSGVTGALPAGSVIVATNVGATNGAYCALGIASSTAQQYISPNGGWFAFTIPTGTNQMTCITSTSTTTINLVGGAGLATGGVGGGAGAGGGSSITSWAGGTLGSMANYGVTPGAVLVPAVNAFVTNNPAVTQLGSWTDRVVGNAGGIFDGPTAGAIPSNALYLGMNVGGNLTGLTGTASGLKVDGSGITQPVSVASLPLPSGAATAANQVAAGFSPSAVATPVAATFAGATGTLPSGAVVVAANVGTTYGAYCNLGPSTSTSAQYIAPNGGWFAFGNPTSSATQITCQTPASGNTTTVNLVGGAGQPAGTGGGGGGSGGSSAAVLGTTNGWTPQILNALSSNKTQVKASTGQAGMLQCYNPNTNQMYVQIFGLPSASVTVGTTPPTLSIPIPPSGTGGWTLSNPGVNFASGITVAATTTATGSTAPGTALDCNMVYN